MVSLFLSGHTYQNGAFVPAADGEKQKTMAARVLAAHDKAGVPGRLSLVFDACASHDITYVGIIQTARASGLTGFPMPYVLTNCHNSLCAVGGTINADDHRFGLSAAQKYGGVFVPAHQAVIHQYMRETMAGGGKMILASDSHTRYGAYGTLSVGEGGPEIVKQLLGKTYDIPYPKVIAVELRGKPMPGVGPQDVALALIGAAFGKVTNCILEFVGPGIAALNMDYRNGIDVMTTETGCLSSLWQTDETVRRSLAVHGREADFKTLSPENGAYYDGLIRVDLDQIEPMIALPFHPSRVYSIKDFVPNAADILRDVEKDAARQWGKAPNLTDKVRADGVWADQGVVAGCSGGLFGNLCRMADILTDSDGCGAFTLSVYPASQPVLLALTQNNVFSALVKAGAQTRSAFCGPCFGAGDVPANGGLSLRHTTRNFPNREGSKPGEGQSAFVALMDARSIAATAARQGRLTAATELPHPPEETSGEEYVYDDTSYRTRVFQGAGRPSPETALVFGPGIADWPAQIPLPEDIALTIAAAIYDEVTTTDELIPSGETSSFRSNPMRLAEFTLSRRAPGYVAMCKAVLDKEMQRRTRDPQGTALNSAVAARKPGDGSAREQAASCQRVLGGLANIAAGYATQRYRSNLINWGMIPFVLDDFDSARLQEGDTLLIRGVRTALLGDAEAIEAVHSDGRVLTLRMPGLTRSERDIILSGCLINYYSGAR